MDMRQFDEDHELILSKIDALQHSLRSGMEPALIYQDLQKLSTRLRLHLAVEDAFLYPNLIDSRSALAAATARRFHEEMGGLRRELDEFLHRYRGRKEISADLPGFRSDCPRLLAALRQRIQRENVELYPLAAEL